MLMLELVCLLLWRTKKRQNQVSSAVFLGILFDTSVVMILILDFYFWFVLKCWFIVYPKISLATRYGINPSAA